MNQELTEDERQEVLKHEEGLIDQIKEENNIGGIAGMIAAANDIEEKVYPIAVRRGGQEYFTFHVRQLELSEFEKLEKSCRIFEKGKGGVRVVKDFNSQQFLAMVIFQATTPEDKKEYWNNPEIKKQLGTVGYQTISKVLRAGEIEDIASYIEEISGRENDLKLGETIKN